MGKINALKWSTSGGDGSCFIAVVVVVSLIISLANVRRSCPTYGNRHVVLRTS